MMELVRDIASWALLLGGSFFLLVGAIGLNRMPDLYSRLHATGISDTLGAGLIFLGLMLQAGFTLVAVKLLFLLLIFFFTSPVASHAVTRAALSVGIEPLLVDSRGKLRKSVSDEVRRNRTAAAPASPGRPKAKRQPGRSKKGGGSSKR